MKKLPQIILSLTMLGNSQLIPSLHSVCLDDIGIYKAVFGYTNSSNTEQILEIGARNGFFYNGDSNLNLGQPSVFLSGNYPTVYEILFDGTPLEWHFENSVVTARGEAADSSCKNIPSMRALLIVDNSHHLSRADNTFKRRLKLLGVSTKVKSGFQVTKMDLDSSEVAVISAKQIPKTNLRLLAESKGGVVAWEPKILLDLGLAKKSGFANNISSIFFINKHPIAANFIGRVSVLGNESHISWADPTNGAIKIAKIEDRKHNVKINVIFGFEKSLDSTQKTVVIDPITGQEDTLFKTKGRRVGLFVNRFNAVKLNLHGWKLFDAAIKWSNGSPLVKGNEFDDVLFASDGTNIQDAFTIKDFDQAVFRLQKSGAGQSVFQEYSSYRYYINNQIRALNPINGLPLLIAKDTIIYTDSVIATQQKQPFFMACLAKGEVFSDKIFVWNEPNLNISQDKIDSVEIEAENTTYVLKPGPDGVFIQFLGEGIKEIITTVHFSSGFVGRNKFKISVAKLLNGNWYNK